MAGVIYKITNPKGKIYIGCTIDFKRRLSEYRRLSMAGQIKLYNSLSKYGYNNHIFEIIEECSNETLHEREIYFIKYYNCIEEGLNIRLGNRTGALTEDTKQKISAALIGREITWDNNGGSKGYKYTDEQIQKMSKPRVNKWERDKLVPLHLVEEIRVKYKNGYKKSNLSREYNVSWSTIKNIVDGINSYKQ